MDFSATEKELYEFIEKKKEVKIDDIKSELGIKYVGALGKLVQANKIERYKKQVSNVRKWITHYGIKKTEKENICDTAPYPKCNGAEGCANCEHQPEE